MTTARLTPRKRDALYAMSREPLTFEADVGWSNQHGGPFNTHSIVWMAAQGLCRVFDDERAIITRAGRQALDAAEGIAA